MIKKLLQNLLLFSAIYICAISAAFSDENGSCVHSPGTLSLHVGQSQEVTYYCNGMEGLPAGSNFMPTFNANAVVLPAIIGNSMTANGLVIAAVTASFGYPFVVRVTALDSGTYSAFVTFISVGGSFNSFVDNDPLSVTVVRY